MRKAVFAVLLVAPAAPVAAQPVTPPARTAGDQDVTVSGRRIQDYRDRRGAWRRGLARPDPEDRP